ncbi:hypothetical protein [Patulibacter defluvii]|uniref:hypothetical protein n=1 Tax=Patulibacter defluvii TaxID=3095358 RepID=UPI002A75882F|nr:hypothetical protein [Patulibacter sp. DM4]
MLFDLRAPGRKRFIQGVYLILAVVLVGGLVLFGVGSGLPGLLSDGNSGGGTDIAKEQRERQEKLEKQVVADPRNGKALASLASVRFDRAMGEINPQSLEITGEARRQLNGSADAWRRYLATKPDPIDPQVAKKMAQVFSPQLLNKPDEWADAQGVVAQDAVTRAEKAGQKPAYTIYLQLLQAEVAAKRTRQAKIHAAAAVAAAPAAQRKDVEAQAKAIQKGEDPSAAAGAGSGTPTTITLPDDK